MKHSILVAGEEPENARLRLIDDRLHPVRRRAEVGDDAHAFDGEETSGAVSEITGVGFETPVSQGAQRNTLYLHRMGGSALGEVLSS